ncbi:MAG: adenylate/guanylate cyclase domain-containing protein [Gemmatimonadota bacterium]
MILPFPRATLYGVPAAPLESRRHPPRPGPLTMLCPACNAANREGRRFCALCGRSLVARCGACGFENEPDERFCGGCGSILHAAGAGSDRGASLRPAAEPSLDRRLHSPEARQGERKQVTVLFADIRGSLELLQGRDPEEAREILDPALQAMTEAVHRYEGTVNNLLGDGIMALFGAPVAHEEHATRACYAALALQSRIQAYNEELRPRHGIEVQARVGLHSGEVVVRALEGDVLDYSAIGETTHVASRMEQLAAPGTIRLTEATFRLAEGSIRVRPLGAVPVRGLQAAVGMYELIGAESRPRRLDAAGTLGFTRFVGRGAEIEALGRPAAAAAAGRGQLVALVGEPGVGKSRLLWEFVRSPILRSWKVLEGFSSSYGTSTAYFPLVELLKGYFRVEPQDDARTVREKVTGKLLLLDESLQAAQPALFALLHVGVEDAEWQRLESRHRRRRTLDAVKRLLLLESRVQPLCIVIEDLHWIDAETEALLGELADALGTGRLLLLVSYRPEYRHDWGGRGSYTQVRIDPLPPETADELLGVLLGDDPDLDSLKAFLVSRTEGNPFFLEQTVRTLEETGALTGSRGSYRLGRPLREIRVPNTVQAVLAARIDRLEPDEKRLLQSAAVIGREIPFPLLQRIADAAEEVTHRALARLTRAEFLYETSLFPELEYTFRHALAAQVAYGMLLQERRRVLHRRIFEAMEELYADRLEQVVERLAEHAEKAEAWEPASRYLHRAGVRVASRSGHREAVALFERALDALARQPETHETLALGIDVRSELRGSLVPLGELDRLVACLHEAEALARRLGDAPRLGRISGQLANYHWLRGEYERAIEAGDAALSIAAQTQDEKLRIAATFYLGQAYFNRGDYRRAAEFNLTNLRALEDASGDAGPASSFLVLAHTWLVWSLAELGEFGSGGRRAEEGLRQAEASRSPFILTHAYIASGCLALRRLDPAAATRDLETALGLCRTYDFPVFLHLIYPVLGSAYALSGRLKEGMSMLERSVQQAESMKVMAGQSLRLTWLAEAYLLAGRSDDAARVCATGLALAREIHEQGYEAWALRLQGEIAAQAEPPDLEAGEAAFSSGLELGTALGMRPVAAQCHRGLAALYRRVGAEEPATPHLAAAADLFREMGIEETPDPAASATGGQGGA